MRVAWAKLVWFPHNIPKQSFLSRLAMRNALKTQEKLVAWGLRSSSLCEFCYTEEENVAHRFFECYYPRAICSYIFSALPIFHSILPWQDEVSWCVEKFKGKGPIATVRRLAFNAFMYCIWEERNAKLYKGKWKYNHEVYSRILTLIRKKISCIHFKVEDSAEARSFLEAWSNSIEFFHNHVQMVEAPE